MRVNQMKIKEVTPDDYRATKVAINQSKYRRIEVDKRTFSCVVCITTLKPHKKVYTDGSDKMNTSEVVTLYGYYLNNCVYINTNNKYYKYRVKKVGVNQDNLMFQILGLATPF